MLTHSHIRVYSWWTSHKRPMTAITISGQKMRRASELTNEIPFITDNAHLYSLTRSWLQLRTSRMSYIEFTSHYQLGEWRWRRGFSHKCGHPHVHSNANERMNGWVDRRMHGNCHLVVSLSVSQSLWSRLFARLYFLVIGRCWHHQTICIV